MSLPRGIRNNNPGNIRWGSDWYGLDPNGKEKDASFCVFTRPEYGIRALARLLVNYQKLHKLNTIRKIIERYAPVNENNTEAYVLHVAKQVGVDADEAILVMEHERMKPLVKAIIMHENGVMPYADKVIDEGLVLAGIA